MNDEQLIDMAAQKRIPPTLPEKQVYRAPLSERTRVWFRNLPHWPTGLAIWYLSRQLQRDKAFRDAWHANIAMPIYDSTRAEFCPRNGFKERPLNWCRDIPIEQSNHIADRLMQRLFSA